MDLFHRGNLFAAAEQWKRELKVAPDVYSVFLELDCLKESVVDAYSRISRKSDFFILPRKRAGQTCFLVLWGKFPTPEDASAALKGIPPSFFQQRDPPQVVALRSYI
jgi:septal ring-binding cell division protein DamX